jgi:hypothetical protein
MKTKYILKTDDDRVIAIFNDLADAEEMYLTFLEEAGYEHCYRCINRDGFRKNLEDYYNPFYHNKDVWKTSEGMYLYVISGGCFPIYLIEEVPYFED